jgi:hypothetical protein
LTKESDVANLSPAEQAISDHEARKSTIEAKIVNVEYYTPPYNNGIICVLTLRSGYRVFGETSCADEGDGQGLAYTVALNRLWELESYLEAERDGQEAS